MSRQFGYTSVTNYNRLHLEKFPSAGPYPSVSGMRNFWGSKAYLLRCGNYLYKVDPDTFFRAIVR